MRYLSLLFVTSLLACATQPPKPPSSPKPRKVQLTPVERIQTVMHLVRRASLQHRVPEDLVLAVIQIESSFRPRVCSHAGACGLMQLMPRTAASLARRMGRQDYDVADPAFNIEAGTAYLAYLLKLFDGNVKLALAGYNAGPMRVRRWVRYGQPIAPKVRRYVANVLGARERFSRRDFAPAPPPPADEGLDRQGLRALLKEKEGLYGERPDEPLPEPTGDKLPATSMGDAPAPGPTALR